MAQLIINAVIRHGMKGQRWNESFGRMHHAAVVTRSVFRSPTVNSSLIDLWKPVDIVTLRATLCICFQAAPAGVAKANKLIWGVRGGGGSCRGRDGHADCHTDLVRIRSSTVGWWQGRGGQENWSHPPGRGRWTKASSLGTKPQCTLSCCITSTIPCQARSPPTLPLSIPTYTRALMSSQSKQWTPGSADLRSHGNSTPHQPRRFGYVKEDKEADSKSATRFGCRLSFLLCTGLQ